jgi:hypothetical protein
VLGLEARKLRFDPEKLGDEILEMRCEGDAEIALVLGAKGVRIGAAGHEAVEEGGVVFPEPFAKERIETKASFARVKFRERQSVRQCEIAHQFLRVASAPVFRRLSPCLIRCKKAGGRESSAIVSGARRLGRVAWTRSKKAGPLSEAGPSVSFVIQSFFMRYRNVRD